MAATAASSPIVPEMKMNGTWASRSRTIARASALSTRTANTSKPAHDNSCRTINASTSASSTCRSAG